MTPPYIMIPVLCRVASLSDKGTGRRCRLYDISPAHLTPSPAEVASSPGLARIYAAIQTLRVLETGKCPAWEGDDRRVPRLCVVADEMREDK